MKTFRNVIVLILILVGVFFLLTACNNIPSNLQGTYKNVVAGSSWVVGKSTVSTPQALLYDYRYNNVLYDTFIIFDTNNGTISVDMNVTAIGAILSLHSNLSGVNKVTTGDLRADSALAGTSTMFSNCLVPLEGYQYKYDGITYLYVSGCEHVLIA